MICNRCNHKLPNDSEFCQYCGNKIEAGFVASPRLSENTEETVVTNPSTDSLVSDERSLDDMTPEEAAKALLEMQAANTVETNEHTNHTPYEPQKVKRKYCSRCGAEIDGQTKLCTGCGKQYFRGFKFNKFSITVMALSLVIAIVSTLCIVQYASAQAFSYEISGLENEIDDLESKVRIEQSKITRLEKLLDKSEEEKWDYYLELQFYDDHAVLVDENSKKYHKYGCEDFDDSYFWIYNTEAAEDYGYYACPKCH